MSFRKNKEMVWREHSYLQSLCSPTEIRVISHHKKPTHLAQFPAQRGNSFQANCRSSSFQYSCIQMDSGLLRGPWDPEIHGCRRGFPCCKWIQKSLLTSEMRNEHLLLPRPSKSFSYSCFSYFLSNFGSESPLCNISILPVELNQGCIPLTKSQRKVQGNQCLCLLFVLCKVHVFLINFTGVE